MIENCPGCGSHNLYEVELTYEGTLGFRPDVYGITPELGDTILSCGECAGFVVLDEGDAAANRGETFSLTTDSGAVVTTSTSGATTTVSLTPAPTPEGGQ